VDLLLAALLGIVQGLTEFLPVSSTAHLLLGERALGFEDPGGVFTVMVQFGSILAVMWIYRAKIFRVITQWPSDPDARRFAVMVVVAFLPAVVAGAFLAGFVKTVLYYSVGVIATAFVAGGIVMLVVERLRPTPDVLDAEHTPVSRALGIGLCQVLAMIPGVSRSGATIVGAMLMRLDRPAAAEFSFFLAMPTMAAAFVHDFWGIRHELGSGRMAEIAVGFVAAFVAALLIVRPFLRFVSRNGFAPFAWYRIVVGLGLFAAMAAGVV
jgi:undecaprenyl-diphosphatase